MKKEIWIFWKGKWVKNPSLWIKLQRNVLLFFKKWKIVDKYNNKIIPISEWNRYYFLSPQEKEAADKIYKEKGTISYEFYPCGGIAWGIRLHVIKTGEVIDITSYENW